MGGQAGADHDAVVEIEFPSRLHAEEQGIAKAKQNAGHRQNGARAEPVSGPAHEYRTAAHYEKGKRRRAGDGRAGPTKLPLKLGKEHAKGEDAAEIDGLDKATSRDNAITVESAFITQFWTNIGQDLGFLGNLTNTLALKSVQHGVECSNCIG